MDFWASLEGQLVTVKNPTSLEFENDFGEFWVYGDWKVTGRNARGGLTITFGPNGVPDANPEVVIVGSPLDGTKNPKVCVGKTFKDITGVIVYQFGFYYVVPLTAPIVVSTPDPTVPPTTLRSSTTDSCLITIGDYNVDNMAPTSTTLPTVAGHIANSLLTPDIVFLQEIQDNSGSRDDGTVIANLTLSKISGTIANLTSGAINYSILDLAPVNDQDGGELGGNIRPAHLFKSSKVHLVPNSTAGGALDATTPVRGHDGQVTLTFNPGRIDPTNLAWNSSRKPLVTQWETNNGRRFFTINVHLIAKLDSSSTQGNSRPPVNDGVQQRTSQVETIATFIKSILRLDPLASIILAGDFNEYIQTRSVLQSLDLIMFELDEISGSAPEERYTYVFDQNTEQLDHIFVSPVVALRGTQVEHVHVNNWASTISLRASDHDPSVARLRVC